MTTSAAFLPHLEQRIRGAGSFRMAKGMCRISADPWQRAICKIDDKTEGFKACAPSIANQDDPKRFARRYSAGVAAQ